ncbi:MAG: patatin-like phospholipase family protein, partial [Gammaproteobacteria bacterium]|nr:patatin-like phospholipase family protein [Gammaproteobacteria bacterium]
MAGASGGAKWLVLSKLDRVVVDTLVPGLRGPVHLIGSSIGAWRFACYAQRRPLEAIERFEEAYLGQSYSEDP